VKTAQQAAANWSGSSGRAAAAYQAGVEGYTGDWAAATVSQEAVLLQNFQQAIARGDWRQGVLAEGTAGWKGATVAKIGNYSTGFSAGAADQAAAMSKIMNALGSIVPSLPPRGTYEQNKTRATSLMDQLHALRGSLGAR
jgi:hypothetical protein